MGIIKMKKVDDVPRDPEDTEQVTFKVDQDAQTTFQYDATKKALCDLVSATMEYLECKDHLEYKKASLLIHTDWGEALPLSNRPTVGDKEAWIKIQTTQEKQKLRELRIEKEYKKELFELEKQKYLKENLDTKEEL